MTLCVCLHLCIVTITWAKIQREHFSLAYLKILWDIKNNFLQNYTSQDNNAMYLHLALLLNSTTVWSKRFLCAYDNAFCTSLNKEDSILFL